MRKKVLVIIPAYNEEKNIVHVLDGIREKRIDELVDVLVIDDGSADHTQAVVRDKGVEVIRQIYNMGYGAALQTGYKFAAEKGYKYLIQLDADGQHDVMNIKTIYESLTAEDAPDMIIGSRYLKGSISFKTPAIRLAVIKMFRTIIRLVTKAVITDPTSGLQGMNRKAFSAYAEYNNFDIRYPDINMLVQMLLLGYRIKEIPAIMYQREEGVAMHSGFIGPMKYMVLMTISTFNAIIRNHKNQKI